MELYKELLIRALQDGNLTVSSPDYSLNELLESRCYQALSQIKTVIEDASLEDDACFNKIEQIICTLEELGSGGGFRHDFG
jgi:hypothetical protein